MPDMELLAAQYQDVAMYIGLGIASGVAIPMQVGEQVLGSFNVGLALKHALEASQISQLEQVAAQLAIAIENRELLQQMQSTLAELDTVNRRLIGQAWEQYARASAALSGEWREGEWRQAQESDTLPANGLRIPIQVRGESIGEFNLTPTGDQNEWTPDDITFAQSLIDQVGQTIENARLFEESERLALRERTINDINSRVRKTIKMDTILETAVKELARSLKATRVFARIGSHDHDLAADANGEGDEHA
jgi:GAF domain-containing protein